MRFVKLTFDSISYSLQITLSYPTCLMDQARQRKRDPRSIPFKGLRGTLKQNHL